MVPNAVWNFIHANLIHIHTLSRQAKNLRLRHLRDTTNCTCSVLKHSLIVIQTLTQCSLTLP